jgi:uncharacterized secreted repeat protein (TIGR03808 family)
MKSPLSRRSLVGAVALAGASSLAVPAVASPRRQGSAGAKAGAVAKGQELGLVADLPGDQSAALQVAIDQAALHGVALELPPGRFRIAGVQLRERSSLTGSPRTVLQGIGSGPVLGASGTHGLRLQRLRVEGSGPGTGIGANGGLVEIVGSANITVEDVTIAGAARNALALVRCSGRIAACRITEAGAAALFSLDAAGLEIVGNAIANSADNGILVWRSTAGEDGTLVAHNRIERIGAASGGSGQNGNGINVFRANGVRVSGNSIADCAYSAVRGNAASNIQIIGNMASSIGEVALYAEFGFQGAVIAQNIVDGAATGISVTNFNEGGRLAVIQGNLIRNLVRREHEPQDKRGEGIAVEADAAVSGNTIESAPTAGIAIGWGRYMRDVSATGNVIRGSRVGITITRDAAAGACLVANNLISGVRDGSIRWMDLGRLVGPDLAHEPSPSKRLTVSGNVKRFVSGRRGSRRPVGGFLG